MCTPKIPEQKLPEPVSAPPPPEETVQDFMTVREDTERKQTTKKRKGTSALQIQSKSPFSIKSGLNIP